MSKITPGDSPLHVSEPILSGSGLEPAKQGGKGKLMTRRQFLGRSLATIVGAGLLTGGYAWQGEPNWLDIVRLELPLKGLPASFDGIKMVQFSDTHLGFNKGAEDLNTLVAQMEKAAPDLICFTGDVVDSEAEDLIDAVPALSRLSAPLGKFAILGNHDYKNTELLTELWHSAGFRVLRNQSFLIEHGNETIAIAGLEDLLHGQPDPQAAIKAIPKGTFTILLMHEPDYADTAEVYPFHLQLSGHSHGGQIRLPWIGALFTPYGSHKYIEGLYYTEARGMPVYVNRGFGETYMPVRMLCRPELTVFTLRRT